MSACLLEAVKCWLRATQTHNTGLLHSCLLQLDWDSPEVNQVLCPSVTGLCVCAKLILVQYKTFLLELKFAELVQTAFQTIYEHWQHEADCLGCLESCFYVCFSCQGIWHEKQSGLRFIYMVLELLIFYQKVAWTRVFSFLIQDTESLSF